MTAVTVESLGDERLRTARLAPDAPVRMGDEITLRPRLAAAYFFDPATGAAIPISGAGPGTRSVTAVSARGR